MNRAQRCLFLVVCLLAVAPPAAAEQPPNVVLILSDDQSWTDYGFMDHPAIETPNIDRLANESLTFTRGYVPHSLCRPSLATIVTGLYPHQHKIVGNDPDPPGDRRPWEVKKSNRSYRRRRAKLITHLDVLPVLPRQLRKQNYLSHQSGKWWEGSYKRGGFTHGMTEGFPNPNGRHGDRGLTIGREGLDPIYRFINEAQERNRPFFVWYAPFLPHRPHNPPEKLLKKYRKTTDSKHVARYRAMCEWFDQTVGDLLGYLDENGLRKNTIVLYLADNGWKQDRDGEKSVRSKRTPYEAGVRTPIMMRWPGRVDPRIDRETPVSSIDLAPTILRACGLAPTSRMPGISLMDQEALEEREAVFGEIFYHDIVDMNEPVESLKYRWCVSGDWKLILPYPEHLPDAPVELYNLETDPHEKNNVAEQHPDRVEALRTKIQNWWTIQDG